MKVTFLILLLGGCAATAIVMHQRMSRQVQRKLHPSVVAELLLKELETAQ